ncbi:hypothetical protein [Phycicoccus sp. Root101]|uniref:hypothetical protein n=1 Tax=Phycicoccus sp. Root101 TaxID=1736421 RepID=UPI00138F5F93|nr:hypothetical protein [Phycicoccus sp. Root101]
MFFTVVLGGIFAIGAVAVVVGLVVAVVARSRDHRTRDERRADEHGDLAPGSARVTPGYGANQIGGMGH